MAAEDALWRDVADRQRTMFAMFVGPGLHTTRAALAAASKMPDSTLKSYAGGAAMPLAAVLHLRRFLPAEAINMLTEPGAARLVDVEREQSNWDAVAADASGLVAEVCEVRAHGRIDHRHDAHLRERARHLAAELSEMVEGG